MELFTVNRYNDPIQTEKPRENEETILQNLLKKVEKRKRKQNLTKSKPQDVSDYNKCGNEVDQQAVREHNVDLNKCTEAHDEEDPISAGAEVEPLSDLTGYEVLGEDIDFAKKQKLDMVLPPWLAYPTVVSTTISTGDENAELPSYLSAHVRQSLKELNVKRLFPVQTEVVPWILEAHAKPAPFRPRDICVSAPTGSGKTLAFALPIVQLLASRVERKVRALVVLPVAELALQVFKVFKKLCERTDLVVCLLSKQFAFPLEQEKLVECYKKQYYSKVDIVITTPGRLVDHLHSTRGFCLKSLEFLVIDEADRIMDAVFQNWIYHLDSHVRNTSDMLLSGRSAPLCLNELQQTALTQPHKLLFSATLSQDPEKLQSLRLFQPKLFTSVLATLDELREKYAAADKSSGQLSEARGEFIGKYTTPSELTEKYCITENRLKPLTLFSLINENSWKKFLCFTNSVESSVRLAFVLKQLFKDILVINELSASSSAKDRANVLSLFSRGKVNGLVCSDALARGIDIPDVDIVISYDPPRHIKTYIHRIGRTARAGRQGTAITLLSQRELDEFNKTLAEVGKVITEEISVSTTTEETHAKLYAETLSALREMIEKKKRSKILHKERAQKQPLIHKNPAEMTLMEKLQMQASEAVKEADQQLENKTIKKGGAGSFKPKKFNPSAGKSKQIKK